MCAAPHIAATIRAERDGQELLHLLQSGNILDVPQFLITNLEHIEHHIVRPRVDVRAQNIQTGRGERPGNLGQQPQTVPRANDHFGKASIREVPPTHDGRREEYIAALETVNEFMNNFQVPPQRYRVHARPVAQRHAGKMQFKFFRPDPHVGIHHQLVQPRAMRLENLLHRLGAAVEMRPHHRWRARRRCIPILRDWCKCFHASGISSARAGIPKARLLKVAPIP